MRECGETIILDAGDDEYEYSPGEESMSDSKMWSGELVAHDAMLG